MKIYHYDENGFYIGTSEAELDPAEWQINHEKVYIIPAFATSIKPPRTNKSQIAKFEGNNWVIYPDYRGQYIVNSDMNTNMIVDIGEIPDGYILITEAQYNKIVEDKFYYIVSDGALIRNPNYDEDVYNAERERIGMLSLTKREVFLALYTDKGITPDAIRATITDAAALIEFDYASEYFRGNPLIDAIGQQLGYTQTDLDYLFENKQLPEKE